MNNNTLPVMLTVNQTAEVFGIAKHHARQLALTGKVKAVRAGKKILINQQSVSDYFNNNNLNSSNITSGDSRCDYLPKMQLN